jgi:hypothetical protein
MVGVEAAAGAWTEFVVKEEHPVPRGWVPVGFPDQDHKLVLQIGLEQANLSALEERLWEGVFLNSPAWPQVY